MGFRRNGGVSMIISESLKVSMNKDIEMAEAITLHKEPASKVRDIRENVAKIEAMLADAKAKFDLYTTDIEAVKSVSYYLSTMRKLVAIIEKRDEAVSVEDANYWYTTNCLQCPKSFTGSHVTPNGLKSIIASQNRQEVGGGLFQIESEKTNYCTIQPYVLEAVIKDEAKIQVTTAGLFGGEREEEVIRLPNQMPRDVAMSIGIDYEKDNIVLLDSCKLQSTKCQTFEVIHDEEEV
jgi:Lhr-like helicase